MQLGKVLLLVNLLFDNNYPPHPIAIYLGAKSSIIHYNNEKYLNLLLQKYSTPFLFLLKVQNVTLLSYFCAYCDYLFFYLPCSMCWKFYEYDNILRCFYIFSNENIFRPCFLFHCEHFFYYIFMHFENL